MYLSMLLDIYAELYANSIDMDMEKSGRLI